MSTPQPPHPTDGRWVRAVLGTVESVRLLLRRTVMAALHSVRLRALLVVAGSASHPESGQGTVEYALVLLGAAAVALLLVAWVARTDLVGRLFDTVVGKILGRT